MKVIGARGWGAHLQREDVTSVDMIRELYDTVLLVPNISNNDWEVTILNIWVVFSQDKLVRFMSYERPLNVFPAIELLEEEKPTLANVFRTMLGLDTVVLEGSNLNHG